MVEQPRGTTSNPYVRTTPGDAWAAEADAAHRRGTQRLLDVRTAPATPPVQAALGLTDGGQVVSRRRLMLLDDVPVEIADSYYPAALAAETPLAAPTKIRGGAVAALGHPATEILEQVTARPPDESEIATLAIDPHEPLLQLTRISYDATGRPVEYSVNRMIARRSPPLTYRLRVVAP
ncbi:GntR family transcriptional regulator [Micromonosporaceae bacterium Da 78-11]